MSDQALISTHAERLRASGVLGRSSAIQRLFEYLVDCSLKGKVPKEIELAIDGFGKAANFDVSQDAMVRVYVHKLRRKLEEFYAGPGSDLPERITIPKGEYRLAIERLEPLAPTPAALPPAPARIPDSLRYGTAALILVLLAAIAWLLVDRYRTAASDELAPVRQTQIWSAILDDHLPIYLVIGDYYIFGERNPTGTVERLVRDFNVNSRDDFERYLQEHPAEANRYMDMDLAYLPVGSAYALHDLLAVLAPAQKRVHVVMASSFDPALFKSAHIIYIGYLSGLGGMLSEIVFAGSHFAVGSTFDELIEIDSGKHYVSEAGDPERGTQRYRDYGYVSLFPGPNGTQNLIVAATRDVALMHAAETLADAKRLKELMARAHGLSALEALYEVFGVSQTNIEGKLVAVEPLDVNHIWSEARVDVGSQASGSHK